jgi:hypothetical protein
MIKMIDKKIGKMKKGARYLLGRGQIKYYFETFPCLITGVYKRREKDDLYFDDIKVHPPPYDIEGNPPILPENPGRNIEKISIDEIDREDLLPSCPGEKGPIEIKSENTLKECAKSLRLI